MKQITLKFLVLVLLLAVSPLAHAVKSYNWETEPFNLALSEEELKEPSVILRDINKIIYYFDTKTGNLKQREIRHYTIKVNNIKGIEDNNEVYIPMRNSELIEAKARVIKKNGTVVNLNKSNIREAKEVEGMGAYNYFAIEGAEEGSLIEVLYITENDLSLNGKREFVQGRTKIKQYVFELESPKDLNWGFKSYNGLDAVKMDSTVKNVNRYYLETNDISPIEPEKYAFEAINKKFLVYRLESNEARGVFNITNLLDISNNVYSRLNVPLSKNAEKKFAAIIKSLGLESGNTLLNVRKFEDYIKHNFQSTDEFQPEFDDPSYLVENKLGNERAFVSLFIHFLKQQNIKYQVGLTCDRTEKIFDPNFDAYYVLDEYFIYLPDEETFVAPTYFSSRVGYFPSEWTENYGLFVRPVSLGNIVKGAGSIEKIPSLPSKKSNDNLFVELEPNEDFSLVKCKVKKELSGFSAFFIQPVYNMMKPESQKEAMESLVKMGGNEDKVVSYKVSNVATSDILSKPMIIEAEVESEGLVEKAGNKFILKVGSVIGQQVEMFQEKPRQQPIEVQFTHEYNKVIKVKIPEGYKIKNPDVVVQNVKQEIDGKEVFGFVSSYKIEGNMFIINVHEYYDFIKLPIDYYKTFEDVVNAAANFYETSIQIEKL
jgi:hypothetical protein